MNIYFAVFIFSVFISSCSQILLKKSAAKAYETKLQEYLNPQVIIAYSIFFIATLVDVLAYKGVPLSMGPILEATGYIWVAVLGRIFLKEKIGAKKKIGLVLILVGIVVTQL